jgi:hypothetical protein
MILYFDVASPVYESLTSTKYFERREQEKKTVGGKYLSPGASSV